MNSEIKAILEFELGYLKKRLPEIEQEFLEDKERIGSNGANACESGKLKGMVLGVIQNLEKVIELSK